MIKRKRTDVTTKNLLERFDKGVNLTAVMQFWGPTTAEDRLNFFSDDNLDFIRSQGIKSVRLISEPSVLITDDSYINDIYDPSNTTPWTIHPFWKEYIKGRVSACMQRDISVVIDLCHIADSDYPWTWSRIVQGYEPRWLDFIREVADLVCEFDSSRIAFEIGNEIGPIKSTANYNSPGTWSSSSSVSEATIMANWRARQEEAITEIRSSCTRCWIFALPHSYSEWEALIKWSPIGDSRTAMVFHNYYPFLFTHQGYAAGSDPNYYWYGLDRISEFDLLTYPADSVLLSDFSDWASGEGFNNLSALFASDSVIGYNELEMSRQLKEVNSWRNQTGMQVICTEFGRLKTMDVSSGSIWDQHMARQFKRYNISSMRFQMADSDWNSDGVTTDFGIFLRNVNDFSLTAVHNTILADGGIMDGAKGAEAGTISDASRPVYRTVGAPSTTLKNSTEGSTL